jgi:hypothetical protein
MSAKTVQPPLKFIQPNLNPWVLTVTQKLIPFWLRYRREISDVKVQHVERLVKLYQQFQLNKTRFLIAFRHPTLDDPACLYHLLGNILPQEARKLNIELRKPTHAHFIYERGIPLWAGSLVGWFFSRLGATPIYRSKADLMGLRAARNLFANGILPMAAAPEGTLNCFCECMNPLEPGTAQLGFWCVDDLQKGSRCEEVVILPVNLQYRYVSPSWKRLENLILQLEKNCGLPELEIKKIQIVLSREKLLGAKLIRITECLLSQLENFYNRFYNQSLLGEGSLDDRLQAFLNVALDIAEAYFGLQAQGNIIERRHRIEQAAWERIYRQDIKNIKDLPPTEYGIANHIVEMSNLFLWNMRLAESFSVLFSDYIQNASSFERLADTALLLWNVMTHIQGGNFSKRPSLGKRWVDISIGEEISVSQRWNNYRINRRQAVNDLTEDLEDALLSMMPNTNQSEVDSDIKKVTLVS